MIFSRVKIKTGLKRIINVVGLLPLVRQLRKLITPLSSQERERYQLFLRFKQQYGKVLRYDLVIDHEQQNKVLVCGGGFYGNPAELCLIKTLELAGYIPILLIPKSASLDLQYFNLTGSNILFLESFTGFPDITEAEAIINRYQSVQGLMTFIYEDARVGLFAVSTTLRILRLGSIDLCASQQRQMLTKQLASAMDYARAAQTIVRAVRPQLVLFIDGVYTPEGEIVDVCLANGLNAISWNTAHKSNALMLKRYNSGNREHDRASLSQKSWQLIRDMPWTDKHRDQLQREIYDCYSKGDWFSDAGTQFNKRLLDAPTINRELGLDPTKKIAFIFPHMLWDASWSRSIDLFSDYEEWLVETIRAACENCRVNWVIKIHPAHVGKAVLEGFHGDPAEVIALEEAYWQIATTHFLYSSR